MDRKSDETHKNQTGFQNTTDMHKQTKESFHQSEEKYRTILENMQEGYFETDLAGNYTFFNDSLCRIHGYSREELMGMNNRQYTEKEVAKKVFQAFHEVHRTGKPIKEINWQIIRKDGIKRDVEASVFLLKDLSGKPSGFRGIIRDITGRKKAEELLRQSEEKYRLLAEHMTDTVWITDLNLKVMYVSPSAEKLLGYPLEELIPLPLDQLFTSESFKEAMDLFTVELPKAIADPAYISTRSLELEFICKNGQTVWGECMFSLIRDDKGEPLSILGEARVITQRKQIENELRASESNFRHSLDDSPLGVRISTLENETVYANRAILDIYGYDSIEELQNTPLKERYTPESYAQWQIRKQERLQGDSGNSEYEISIVRKTGEIRHLLVFRKEICWNGKKQSQVIYNDITERKKVEEHYRLLADNITEHVWLRDLYSLKIIYISPSVEKMYGYPIDEARKIPLKKLLTEESFQRMVETFITEMPKALKTLPPSVHKYSIEMQAHHRNGHLLWMDNTISFIRDKNGNITLLLGETRDITERRLAEERLQKTLDSLRKAVSTTIQVLVSALEARDPYTAGHQSRTADLARTIATEMGLSHDIVEGIRMAGVIHDIGKLSIPAEILSKPSKLTSVEFSLIKEHAKSGYEMLKYVDSPWPLAQIVYQHHERMNGTGYPNSLKGDEIILEARVMAVADVVEAMASHRPYRASLGIDAALEEIEKNKGILYDEAVTAACLKLFREKNYKLP